MISLHKEKLVSKHRRTGQFYNLGYQPQTEIDDIKD